MDEVQSTTPAAADIEPRFADALFGRAAPEDLAQYRPEALAALAGSAYQHLCAPRKRGRHDIRVFDPDPSPDEKLASVSVIEVVNDDMPFLLDSTLAELGERGLEIRLVAHPILRIARNPDGNLIAVSFDEGDGARESLIHIHVERLADEAERSALVEALDRVYRDVRLAFEDWPAMRARIAEAIAAYEKTPPPLPAEEISEAIAFLRWLVADNFTFLGLRDYRFAEIGSTALDPVAGAGLGTLRDPHVKVLRRGRELVAITPEVLEFLKEPHALIIAKANVKSRVHRRVQMDYVGVKLFSPEGKLEGELRLVGLFTSSAYTQSTQTIPYIRHKVARVLAASHLDPQSHSGKALTYVLETYPRDELFQVDVDTLAKFSAEIARLYERPRLRVLARADRFDRFVSVLTFIPRDRYDTSVRQRVGEYLAKVYNGRVSATYPFYPEGPLVRTHFIIGRDEGVTPQIPREELEARIGEIVRTWSDKLADALIAEKGARGAQLAARYATAFSAGYMEAFGPKDAIADIAILERVGDGRPRAVVVYPIRGEAARAGLKVFTLGRPMPLSERVPLLEDMGFSVISESTYDIKLDQREIWLHDMALERALGGEIDVARCGPKIESMLAAIFRGEGESDGLNALVVAAGLAWRDIAMLRTLSRFLQQARVRYSQDYMAATLVRNAEIAAKLVELFYVRFDPRRQIDGEAREANEAELVAAVEAELASVASLDEDRIIRRFLNLLTAAIRTNFFQVGEDGMPREVISFKFESRNIDGLPVPRPLYEITVYSPRVEGVHMRFGKVARGGLRWSDRPQDFRTEILGLAKAQQVKNAVIVPVGAKGGFVPKRLPPPANRDLWLAEGTAAYEIFVSALLDLTDNLAGDAVVPPAATRRHDDDDPYLVVAADKGTATFSDIANSISIKHGFWLGDAFASGGSAGYDHKKMGITARGAWEAVKRHFREMDTDIQQTPFTVAGVGDMSGDVFGNGMLLSPQIRLVAAFDHRDIFLDPDPDPAISFAERARLFGLSRSSWQDYDKALISKGGGVFSRTAKSILLSSEAQALLGLGREIVPPQEVLSAILKARVDLLWFGGIGTYVRASDESDDAVGDRANDAIRVTGAELGCKVIGEGANLGVTQRGRIEAARRGIRLNTDAIDNSAGVNTSDVEVNLKIALTRPLRDGRLDENGRNQLLASMTSEVAHLVLRNNYQQTLALSLAERRAADDLGFVQRLMAALEEKGRLDRAIEFLPDDSALAQRARAGQGLTRPELAVLLPYAKLALHDELLNGSVLDDSYLARELADYFPKALYGRYRDAVERHPLRREIIATTLANAIINRCGPTVLARIADNGADAGRLAEAFLAAWDVFALEGLIDEIDRLDAKIAGPVQLDLYADVQSFLVSRVVWFLRNADFSGGLGPVVARFRAGVEILAGMSATICPRAMLEAMTQRGEDLERRGVPCTLAMRVALQNASAAFPEIVLVSLDANQEIAKVAETFFAADLAFGLGPLMHAAGKLAIAEYYDRLALDAALGQIEAARRRLTAAVVATAGDLAGSAAVERWVERGGPAVARIRHALAEVTAGGLTLSRVIVAAGLASALAPG